MWETTFPRSHAGLGRPVYELSIRMSMLAMCLTRAGRRLVHRAVLHMWLKSKGHRRHSRPVDALRSYSRWFSAHLQALTSSGHSVASNQSRAAQRVLSSECTRLQSNFHQSTSEVKVIRAVGEYEQTNRHSFRSSLQGTILASNHARSAFVAMTVG